MAPRRSTHGRAQEPRIHWRWGDLNSERRRGEGDAHSSRATGPSREDATEPLKRALPGLEARQGWRRLWVQAEQG